MPFRTVVAKELAGLLGVLSHPNRIRILEELKDAEHDVNALSAAIGISHSGASQHLTLLRAHRLVLERREGRHVFYHLRQPAIAAWLVDATRFLEPERDAANELRTAIQRTRRAWSGRPANGRAQNARPSA